MSNSIIDVTTPAPELAILSPAELRDAIGLDTTDESEDSSLTIIGARISDRVARVCNITSDGVNPPTLFQETLTQTFRFDRIDQADPYGNASSKLVLARRPIVSVASVIESFWSTVVPLDAAQDYEIGKAGGFLTRLRFDRPALWHRAGKIVVTFTAGFAVIPESVKAAAAEMVQLYWYAGDRDPALSQISIPGVLERRYNKSPGSDADFPQAVLDMLRPFKNEIVG